MYVQYSMCLGERGAVGVMSDDCRFHQQLCHEFSNPNIATKCVIYNIILKV